MGPANSARKVIVERITKETKVQVALSLDRGALDLLPNDDQFPSSIPNQDTEHHASQDSGSQQVWIWIGFGFLDHMLHVLSKHAGWSLRLRTHGDLAMKLVDDHHTTEDAFLGLGQAYAKALGDRKGLQRFGDAHASLDEAVARAVIDISSRLIFVGEFGLKDPRIGTLSTQVIHHGLQSFIQTVGVTLHVDILKGDNDHHRAGAAFRALAFASKDATAKVAGKEGQIHRSLAPKGRALSVL